MTPQKIHLNEYQTLSFQWIRSRLFETLNSKLSPLNCRVMILAQSLSSLKKCALHSRNLIKILTLPSSLGDLLRLCQGSGSTHSNKFSLVLSIILALLLESRDPTIFSVLSKMLFDKHSLCLEKGLNYFKHIFSILFNFGWSLLCLLNRNFRLSESCI